jgi:SAM-dependent methyltransferase
VYVVSKLEQYKNEISDNFNDIKPLLYQGKSDFNNELLSEILNENYLDVNKLECISMMIEYILYWTTKNTSINDTDKRYNFISYFMNNVNQVLPNMIYKDFESSHGYVVFSDLIKMKNKLVIKTPKDEDETRSMLFEYYIGSKFINKLRKKTPNFMYTFGIFMCNSLVKVKNDKPELNVGFCNDSKKKNIYIMFEKVDGTTLHDYILKVNTEKDLDNIVNVILQVMLSLDIAQKEGEYVHNDLHTDNVMLRKIKSPIRHEYLVGKHKYEMNMEYIATIIDYGMNRFVENGIPLGVTIFNKYNIFPYKNTISTDLFKLLISSIFSIIVIYTKNQSVYAKLQNKIEEVIEFLISFFRSYPYKMIKLWDTYLLNKNKQNFENFKNEILNMKNTYYYPMTNDNTFLNDVTPENFIKFTKNQMPHIWNKHVNYSVIDTNEIFSSYIPTFDPLFDNYEYDDYIFTLNYNNIYLSKFIEQKKIFYQLFNKEFNIELTDECLTDHESMILNFNNILDCKKITDAKKSSVKELDIINNFEKYNIKHINKYYKNDIELLTSYITQMDEIYNEIDINLINLYNKSNSVKVSMNFFNENMKIQIRKMHEFLKIFQKYIRLTSFSIDLNDIANKYLSKHEFKFNSFLPDLKYFEKSLVVSDCINKYNRIINEYYNTRLTEETYKRNTNVYTFYNLNVILQNMNPHFSELYNNFAESFLNIKQKLNYIPLKHYLPVKSNQQFQTFLSLKNYNIQIQLLNNIVSRFVNYDNAQLKEIFQESFVSKMNDIDIYNKLRESRKIKDLTKKEKRDNKRSKEVFELLNKSSKKLIFDDTYYHLDFGGNDGAVASGISNLMKVNNTQVYSADVETWLGNTKKKQYDNILYTMLNENQKLPYANESFNSISCLQVFHHLEFLNSHLEELYRVMKHGGILIIKEHDCDNLSTQLLIDIEHMIHEYVEPEIPNTKILNNYVAFYKSFIELDYILKLIGFKFILDKYDFNPDFNPTRYYFAVYKKI